MEESFIKKFLMVSTALFLLALASAIVFRLELRPWFKEIRAEITSQPYARTITVTAEGKVAAKPDIAVIDFSVVSQGKTVKAVTQDSNVKMAAVIEAVKKAGVDAKDISSTDYNLYPVYSYPEDKPPQMSGYNLHQQIRVKVRDLEKTEDVLDTGVSAGADQVGQLSFDIDDSTTLKQEARTQAFAAAKEKAFQMAEAAGVKLGRVVTFSEGDAYQPPVYANYRMDVMSEAAAPAPPTLEPGTQEININVSMTYEID